MNIDVWKTKIWQRKTIQFRLLQTEYKLNTLQWFRSSNNVKLAKVVCNEYKLLFVIALAHYLSKLVNEDEVLGDDIIL